MVDLYNRCLANAYARSRRDLEEFRRSTAKSTNEKLRLFEQLAGVILDEEVSDERVRLQIYQRVSPEQLRDALVDCQQLVRPESDHYLRG